MRSPNRLILNFACLELVEWAEGRFFDKQEIFGVFHIDTRLYSRVLCFNMSPKEITPRQKQLLEIIYSYIKNSGYPPTFEEMREALGVSSNQSIIDLLEKLKVNELIRKSEGARSLVILPLGYEILQQPSLVAFLGVTTAGASMEPLEIPGEWQAVSKDTSILNGNIFLLKIMGDSMINAGIEDNDMVLVKERKEFVSGDIVLAQIQDEKTVKRFVSDDKPPYVYLKPENPNYGLIPFTDEMQLLGKVVSVIKHGQWRPVK